MDKYEYEDDTIPKYIQSFLKDRTRKQVAILIEEEEKEDTIPDSEIPLYNLLR